MPNTITDEGKAASLNTHADRFADVHGIRLAYRIAGTGTPVVLLHGYTQTGYMWHRSSRCSPSITP